MAKRKAKAPAVTTKTNGASIIDRERVAKYRTDDKIKTASGRRAVDCDDEVARALRGKDPEALEKIAKREKLDERWNGWAKLNPGQRRMALGNAMRAKARAKGKQKAAA